MKLTPIIACIAIAPLFTSCDQKKETSEQAPKNAKQETVQETSKAAHPQKKPTQQSNNPHVKAAQGIGEKLQKSADKMSKDLDDGMKSQ